MQNRIANRYIPFWRIGAVPLQVTEVAIIRNYTLVCRENLKSYETPVELERGIAKFVMRYNTVRPHQSLSGATPDETFNKQLERAA
jgi:hypothetical protein